jgi:endonuclease YncB( thermonuclease family)
MIAKPKRGNSWFMALLGVAAIAVWAYQETQQTSQTRSSGPAEKRNGQAGAYEIHRNCTLVEARNNDGDSFIVRLPTGKQAEFRLYFVDTPESAFKSYRGGETNHERIRQQAADMGGITPEQAVEIGKKAKSFSLGLLASRPFDIYTRWDSPFGDDRFHAFVEVKQAGKPRFLSELLVERGFARIKTKPADLPDGTPAAKQLGHLKALERDAKRAASGVWSF